MSDLNPTKWRYRLPFYGREISTDPPRIEIRADNQEVMDQEIAAAKGKLDYWAFLHYPVEPSNGNYRMNISRQLYLENPNQEDISFTFIAQSFKPQWIAEYLSMIRQPNFQTVLGGRPLVYVFNPLSTFDTREELMPSEVDAFRAAVRTAGIPNPYIVGLEQNEGILWQRLGVDAMSAYTAHGGLTDAPYSALAEANRSYWERQKVNYYVNLGIEVIPIVNTGWDPRPLTETGRPGTEIHGSAYYLPGTPQEIADNVKAAMEWNRANPAAGEANTVLIYAWNEISEGGWLLPSNPTFNPEGSGRLDAIRVLLS